MNLLPNRAIGSLKNSSKNACIFFILAILVTHNEYSPFSIPFILLKISLISLLNYLISCYANRNINILPLKQAFPSKANNSSNVLYPIPLPYSGLPFSKFSFYCGQKALSMLYNNQHFLTMSYIDFMFFFYFWGIALNKYC